MPLKSIIEESKKNKTSKKSKNERWRSRLA